MDTDLESFLTEFNNYDFGVRRIIPATITSPEDIDSAFSDELDSLLFARDYLEEALQEHPDSEEYDPFVSRIRELDSLLIAKRHVVMQIITNYPEWRDTLKIKPPKSHWWWYLDQIDQDGYETQQEVISLETNRLGVVLDEEIASRMGLKAGQRITVRISDDRHILISVD